MADPATLKLDPNKTYTLEAHVSRDKENKDVLEYALLPNKDINEKTPSTSLIFKRDQVVDLTGDATNVTIVIPKHMSNESKDTPPPRFFFDDKNLINSKGRNGIEIRDETGQLSNYYTREPSLKNEQKVLNGAATKPVAEPAVNESHKTIILSVVDGKYHVTVNGVEPKGGDKIDIKLDDNSNLHITQDTPTQKNTATLVTTPKEITDLDIHATHERQNAVDSQPDRAQQQPGRQSNIQVGKTKGGRVIFEQATSQQNNTPTAPKLDQGIKIAYNITTDDNAVRDVNGNTVLTFGDSENKFSVVIEKGVLLNITDRKSTPLVQLDGNKTIKDNTAAFDDLRKEKMGKMADVIKSYWGARQAEEDEKLIIDKTPNTPANKLKIDMSKAKEKLAVTTEAAMLQDWKDLGYNAKIETEKFPNQLGKNAQGKLSADDAVTHFNIVPPDHYEKPARQTDAPARTGDAPATQPQPKPQPQPPKPAAVSKAVQDAAGEALTKIGEMGGPNNQGGWPRFMRDQSHTKLNQAIRDIRSDVASIKNGDSKAIVQFHQHIVDAQKGLDEIGSSTTDKTTKETIVPQLKNRFKELDDKVKAAEKGAAAALNAVHPSMKEFVANANNSDYSYSIPNRQPLGKGKGSLDFT